MRRGQSLPRQALPDRWLLSDSRNDEALEESLVRLPRRSGFIYRHYHLPPAQRRQRFRVLARLARSRDHFVILADSAITAHRWGADGCYGSPERLGPRRAGLLYLATAHDLHELAQAWRAGGDAVLLSPVFTTRSHADAGPLGPLRFRFLARQAQVPVIALGGMTSALARHLEWPRWAAIDGLSAGRSRPNS